ncbi:MAG: Gx transporter family protein [Vallitaleaceae bacterium]|jgi:heptaprenyl diphosphate synthase|nr:Gx transporter family protein [Vallitaleaceae bacterium]
MPYQTDAQNFGKPYSPKKLVLMALFVAVALVLSYIERLIPLNFAIPGVKLGLANVVTCIALYTFRPKDTLLIVLVRIFLVGIFIGSATSFLYSFAGGTLSFIGMLITLRLLKKYVSAIGVSVVGAFLHNLGQVIVLGIITSSLSVALTYFPILILTGVITGVVVGSSALLVFRYMKHFKLIQTR